jgi:CRISPR-associated RAMP protein (TIGR02581 family)
MSQDSALPMRYEIRNRYVFEGKLEMKTGLHIGGGKATLSYTDSPVVMTPDELPYIPGSSFKGVLRSTVEKFVASLPSDLGLHSCGLPLKDVQGESCPTARQKEIANARRRNPDIIEQERKKLCHTCQLFGSPFAAARITVNDFYLIDEEWSGATQVRDGVAIDRDSETAKPGLKYDFEVVPATTVFKLRIMIENATEQDLQLITIGLSEFVNGFGGVGGFRSRGLGACILNDLTIRAMRLDDLDNEQRKQRLLRYLRRKKDEGDDGLDALNVQDFFEQHINALFQPSASNQ